MKSTFRILVICLLTMFPICVGAAPLPKERHTDATSKRFAGHHIQLEGVRNFGEVTPLLYRGGQPTHEGFQRLAKKGFDVIVDTGRSKPDEQQVRHLGMRYVSIPWHCPFPKDDAFARFLKLIKDNPNKKIFVHCRLGTDRTGMMIAAYRMSVQHWTAEQAMEEMHSFGYSAVHHMLCPGLVGYEKSFPERWKKNPAFRAVR